MMGISKHRRCGNKSAQGNALGSGQTRDGIALKGQNRPATTRLVSPLQGNTRYSARRPRALPWADLLPHLRCSGPIRSALALIVLLATHDFACTAEIATNGVGGGPWSDPATWRGKVVPGPKDDVVILKFDVAIFDKNDDGKISCRKLQIDPKGALFFKTGAGKQVCCIAEAIDCYGVIKLDGTKSANDSLELRMVGASADQRKIKLNKGAAFLLYGKANLPKERRNVALHSPKLADQKDDLVSVVDADGFVSIDWQRAEFKNVKLWAKKIDNTGAKANERINLIENQFTGQSRINLVSCDTPIIAKNSFEYAEKTPLTEAAINVSYSPLAEIKSNNIRGAYAVGITVSNQSDSVLENNTIEKCSVGIACGYGVPNTMIKKCVVRGCELGIKLEGASGVIEDTIVEGATTAFHQQKRQLTTNELSS